MKRAISGERPKAGRLGMAARVADFLEYMLLLTVILECNSMYVYVTETAGRVDVYEIFYHVALASLAALLLLRAWQNPRSAREALPGALVAGGLLAYGVAFYFLNVRAMDDWKRENYVMNFLLFLPMLTFYFKLRQREGKGLSLLYKFSDVMCVLGGLSLVVFLAGALRPDSVPADVIYTRWNDRNVTAAQIDMLEVFQSVSGIGWQMFGISLLRNRSLFTEALMFALPLMTALLTELFLREGRGWGAFRRLLLTAVLVTVNATIALMLTALAWGMKGVSLALRGRRKWLIAPIALAAALACAVLFIEKGKLTYESTEAIGSSLGYHIDDYRVTLKGFLESPLLGGGYHNEPYIRGFMSAFRLENNPGLSNSAGVVLAEGGLMLGALCMLPFLIWALYLFRQKERGVALWGVGMLGAYVGIIFKYHMFMMLIMAFGYSLPEVRLAKEGRFAPGLSLARLELIRDEGAGKRRRAAVRRRRAAFVLALVASAALIGFGAPLWRALHALIRGYQLSVGQLPLRSYCFALALLLNGVCLRWVLSGRRSWGRLAALLAWDAAYLAAYPLLFSGVYTLMELYGLWGELRECCLLLLAYLIPAALVLEIRPRRWLNRRGAALAGAVAAAVLGVCLFGRYRAARLSPEAEALVPALENLVARADGPVYVDELPLAYHLRVPGVSLTTTHGMGHEAKERATVVFPENTERRELLEQGFMVAELTEGWLAYSNDGALIEALTEQGTAFHRYYPFRREADLEFLAEENRLSTTEDGALVVDGPIESLNAGPYDTVFPSRYAAGFDLHVDPERLEALAPDAAVCSIGVNYRYGQDTLAGRTVTRGEFDAAGDASAEVSLGVAEIVDGVEYRLIGEPDLRIEVRSVYLRQTPDYVTVTAYNSHRDPIREAYYAPDGAVYTQPGGYAVIERDYNMTDRVIAVRYYDAELRPVSINEGYAEIRYGYNEQGSVNREAFFGVDGQPVTLSTGYAVRETDYDAYGNPVEVRYYDADGNPVNGDLGYARVRREYDESRQVVSESYFDAEGALVAQPGG